MKKKTLPFKNIIRKPARTAALTIIVFLMSFTLLGGTLAVMSLQRGLDSLETRLGADIIVIPDTAKSKVNLENIIFEGVPGYFYMDKSYVDKLAQVEGVEKVSAQYYLASLSAGCCSMPVQIIGYDPETDFSVTPWIKKSYGKALGELDIVIGYNVNKDVDSYITLYGLDCKVAAKLEQTGTELDNAVYANVDTVKRLIAAAKDTGINELSKKDPEKIVSSVMIKVEDGYGIDDVAGDINIYVRHVQAYPTRSMISGIADSLSGISGVIRVLIAAVWVFVFVLLCIVFAAMVNERKKEFAIYRVMGMSRAMLASMVLYEGVIISAAGALLGCAVSALGLNMFSTAIENSLNLPFLLPNMGALSICAAVTFVLSVVISAVSSFYAAVKLSRVDPGLILREGN